MTGAFLPSWLVASGEHMTAIEVGADTEDTARPWKRLWAAYASFFLLSVPILGAGTLPERGAPLGDALNAPGRWLTTPFQHTAEALGINEPLLAFGLATGLPRALLLSVAIAPLWLWLARRSVWQTGIPTFWSALMAALLLCLSIATLQLAPLLIGHPGPHTARLFWWGLCTFFLFVGGLIIGTPLILLIARSRLPRARTPTTTPQAQRGMPWWRMLAAYLVVLAVPVAIFWTPSLLTGESDNLINEFGGLVVLGMVLPTFLGLALVLSPLWWFVTRHRIWKHGAPDYWACVIATALLYLAIVVLLLIYLTTQWQGDAYDAFALWLLLALGLLTVGSLVSGGLVYFVAGAKRSTASASSILDIASLPQPSVRARRQRVHDLTIPIRVRERLDVINALFSSWYALFPFLIVFILLLALVVYGLTLAGLTENLFGTTGQGTFIYITSLAIAAILLSIPLSFIARVHRRALAGIGAALCLAIIGYSCWRIWRFIRVVGPDDPLGIGADLTFSLIVAALPTWVVFGLMFGAYVGLSLAPRSDFLIGRGWRPKIINWVSNGRRFLGMPNYISSLGRSQWITTSLFVSAIVFFSAWVAMPSLSAFPWGGTSVSALGYAEGNIAQARATCHGTEAERGEAYLSRDATFLSDTPLDACVERVFAFVGGRFGGLTQTFTMFALAGIFALVGLPIGRAALRSATRAYQNVRDWDERPPVVFLRAFRADEAHVPANPHGLLPRLAIRPGAARTLDEIVLDIASPIGPVIAIGRPDEELPPLGAARIYAAGQDWREIVTQLCDSAVLVIICLDASEGVNWEYAELLRRGHEQKTVLLTSPQLGQTERRQLVAKLFGSTASGETIGALVDGDELVLLSAPRVSRAAYKTALTLGLSKISADFGQGLK